MKPIFLLGEAMGDNEVKVGRGFVGASGIELLKMLNEADVINLTHQDFEHLRAYYNRGDPFEINHIWAAHPELYRSNVFQLHPPSNNLEFFCGPKAEGIIGYAALVKGKYVMREYEPQLDRLGDEILAVDPNLIVCLGNAAVWALTGRTGVSKLRGTTGLSTHTVRDYKFLVTYHPAAVLRGWELRPVTLLDLAKINNEKEFQEVRRPKCELWVEPSIEDIERFYHDHIVRCKILSVDVETAGTRVTCIGFAPRHDLAIVIPFDDDRKPDRSYWPTAVDEGSVWKIVRRILEDPSIPKVFQNGLYDIAFIYRSYGIRTLSATHDTMLLHHALLPESLKSLGFLGSVYTDHGPWKTERKGMDQTIKRDA